MEILHIATIAVFVTAASAWLLYDFWRNVRGSTLRDDAATRPATDAIPRWMTRERLNRIGPIPPLVDASELPEFGRRAKPVRTARQPRPKRRTGRGGSGSALGMSA